MRPDELHILQQFFGGAFHQDWDLNGPTADAVIDHLISSEGDRSIFPKLAALIAMFIDEHPDDNDLAMALQHDLWCEYVPDEGARSWLSSVAARLRDADQAMHG